MTVAQCLDYWFDNYVSTTLREKTQALYRSTVMKRMHDAFPNRPASSITVTRSVCFAPLLDCQQSFSGNSCHLLCLNTQNLF